MITKIDSNFIPVEMKQKHVKTINFYKIIAK